MTIANVVCLLTSTARICRQYSVAQAVLHCQRRDPRRFLRRTTSAAVANREATFPVEDGRVMPGCGAIVAAIESASGRKPDLVVGKPRTTLLQMLGGNVIWSLRKSW
jgi:ribonucleotide monophosphatase NagD (HAD superfamily)